MKKSVLGGLALLALGVSASGCAIATGGNGAVAGGIYSGYKMGGVVGTGPGTKMGQACASSILGLIGTGDASISAAKRAGSISTVAYVDHDVMSILGIYGTSCTVVYGD
jgi:hypothetical protein